MSLRVVLRQSFWAVVSTSLFALIASCAAPNVRTNYSLAEAQTQGHGLLIGMISANTQPTMFSFNVRFFFDPDGNQPVGFNSFQLNTDCASSGRGNLQSKGMCTHLLVVDLPAGQYTLTGWNIFSAGFFPYSVNPLVWWPQRFTILSGKATYIGHIYMHITYQHSKIGHDVTDGWPDDVDQHDTDIEILSKHYPSLSQRRVLYDVLVFPPRGKTIICPCG